VERFLSVVSRSWVEFTKLAVALGVAYFLTARLSFFVFRAEPGVAVFWPASGIAVGVFDRLGFQGATADRYSGLYCKPSPTIAWPARTRG